MDMITTRRAGGAKVGVTVGDWVAVAVCVRVAVTVAVAVNVAVADGVKVEVGVEGGGAKGSPAATGSWQASRKSNEKTDKSNLRIR